MMILAQSGTVAYVEPVAADRKNAVTSANREIDLLQAQRIRLVVDIGAVTLAVPESGAAISVVVHVHNDENLEPDTKSNSH